MMHAIRRLLSFLHRNRLDDQLSEEIQLHLELRRQALVQDGMSPADAEREALRQFGNVTSIRERTRDQWGSPAVDAFLGDLRLAVRMMARSRGLSATVVLTIALGAGVNAALFMLLNNLLLRPPPIPGADRVVWLDDGRPLLGPTYPDYIDYRHRASGAMDLAAYATAEVLGPTRGDAPSASLRAVLASGNYFSVLQARPALGRTFGYADDLPPLGTASVVLSDAYWTRHFNRDPNVLGQTIDLNLKPFTIIGVLPAGFSGARAPNGNPYVPDVWVPLWCQPQLEPGDTRLVERITWWGLQAIGRLHEGVSVGQAQAQVSAVGTALDVEYPGKRRARTPWISRVTDIDPRIVRTEQGIVLSALGVASMFVLLIACANVAGLLLARASTRGRETAVRLSLGASRARIVRQFLGEGLLLAVMGTVLGSLTAGWVLQGVMSSGGTQPLAWSFAPDRRMIAFAGALAIVATISTGLMPALQASKTVLLPALTRADGVRIGRLRTLLVSIQVAASVVLVLATALLLRAVIRAHAIDPGLAIDQLFAVEINPKLHGYQGPQLEAVLREVRLQIEALPGVASTATASPAPFSGNRSGTTVRLAEAPDSPGVRLFLADVSTSFLETAGLQIVRGRWLDERNSEEVVINQALAARLWPSVDPLGARVTSGDSNGRSHVVVGIVRDTAYIALRQYSDPFMFRPGTAGTILVRTSGPAGAMTRAAASAAARVDRRFAVSARPLSDRIADELRAARAMISVAAGVGFLALFVALAGVAATAAQSVAQRTREIGVRMALGATQQEAVTFIVRRALTPVAIGAIVGLTIATQASRVLTALLYGVSRFDPIALSGGITLVMAATAMAAWLPARRATSIDPVRALRTE
jgi:predicted permease